MNFRIPDEASGFQLMNYFSLNCTDKGQATLSLGMDLNLDWMTLDDFQKHLNGEDEILSGPPLSPSEYLNLGFDIFWGGVQH